MMPATKQGTCRPACPGVSQVLCAVEAGTIALLEITEKRSVLKRGAGSVYSIEMRSVHALQSSG